MKSVVLSINDSVILDTSVVASDESLASVNVDESAKSVVDD